MRIVVGSDHGGVVLKGAIVKHLSDAGHDVIDVGTDGESSVDYPDYGSAVAEAVVASSPDKADLGIAVCGSGLGICIAANKVDGARAITAHDVTSAHLGRLHNDANVLCLGERLIGQTTALAAVDAFIATEFEGGRHCGRVDKITNLEQKNN